MSPPELPPPESAPSDLDRIAEGFVRLVVALSLHDPDYMDAYHGPPEWRRQAEEEKAPPAEIRMRSSELVESLPTPGTSWGETERLRHRFLEAHLGALETRARMVEGHRLSFDEESEALYGITLPPVDGEELLDVLDRIDRRLTADGITGGTVRERLETFRAEFTVPAERIDEVFRFSLETARDVTAQHLSLPSEERFQVEYVDRAPWSAYNWYQGSYESLIQVNLDFPVRVYELMNLACHEGYPGHHSHHALLERHLLRDRGWLEHSVYALFSPHALTSEGVASVAPDLAFSAGSRLELLREELFPRAALDPERAAVYLEILDLQRELAPASAEAARRHLDGELDADGATRWLVRHLAIDPRRAARAVRFHQRYGAYIVTYHRGREILAAHLEDGGGGRSAEIRWNRFRDVVTTPRLVSDLEPRQELPPRSPLDPIGTLSPV